MTRGESTTLVARARRDETSERDGARQENKDVQEITTSIAGRDGLPGGSGLYGCERPPRTRVIHHLANGHARDGMRLERRVGTQPL